MNYLRPTIIGLLALAALLALFAQGEPAYAADHDVEARLIGGGAPTLSLFLGCGPDPCTVTQNHELKVTNNSDHGTEDIRVEYTVIGWPAACTVTSTQFGTQFGGDPITVKDIVKAGIKQNASNVTAVMLTFSCPKAEKDSLVGTPINFRLEAVHRTGGVDDQPDDDVSNDIFTKAKIIN